MGLQVRGTSVDGETLVVKSRLSLNMASLTLEQVAGKRRGLIEQMGTQLVDQIARELEASAIGYKEKGVAQLRAQLLDCARVLHQTG